MAHVALHAQVHRAVDTWLILTDLFHAFNIVKRPPVLVDAAVCAQALTPFAAKCYAENHALVSSRWMCGRGTKSTATEG